MLVRCSRCGRDAPADTPACPFCGSTPPARRRWLRNPIVYGALAAAVEMALLFAVLRC